MGFKGVIADSAIDDLREIVAYIARDDPQVAARVGNKLIDYALTLAAFPERAPFFDEARGIRKTVAAPYLIFLTVGHTWPASVDVIHFWNGARQYPKVLKFLHSVLCCALALGLHAAFAGDGTAGLERFAFEKTEMGLPFRITLFAADEGLAKSAADAAFARVAELNGVLSDYDPDSELSRLSRTSGQGKAVRVSDDLWRVLERGQAMAARTDGAFDLTVGPLVNVWRRARRKQELPSPGVIAEMRGRVGFRNLKLDAEKRTAELLIAEMRLDAGSIGKAYAVDAALAVLKQRGITRALVGGSGDMAAGDAPPGLPGWRIEVAALDAPGAPPPQIVHLANRGIATSGDVFQRVEIDGKRYSHIVDPHTGLGLTDHSLVTVIAPDCFTANCFTTSASVVGPERGLKLIDEKPGIAALLVRKPGEKIEFTESRAWKEVTKRGGGSGAFLND